jgi:unsaturated chondroitin disaccharide hydrolase
MTNYRLYLKICFLKYTLRCVFCLLLLNIIRAQGQEHFNLSENISYCGNQAQRTLTLIPKGQVNLPRSIDNGKIQWRFTDYHDWCSGFWPASLWYLYEATHNLKWKTEADRFASELTPLSYQRGFDHDLGFMVFNSFGNGYRLTNNPEYKKMILRTADSMATLFNNRRFDYLCGLLLSGGIGQIS